MVRFATGYYTQDYGDGDVTYYFMNDEPPDGQFIFLGGAWRPLIYPFYLADLLMDGNPEVSDPVTDPPEGVPPFESPPAGQK